MAIHAQIIPDLNHGEPRRSEPRIEAGVDVALRELGSTGGPARLVNVSSRGFMAETDAAIQPGARVWLALPGMPRINALVIWVRGGRIGGEFAQPVDPLSILQGAGKASASRR